MSIASRRTKFRKVNVAAIASLFLVILAGGVVRSSGSGMGCPDWPKCFGRYIPPTDASQLPKDYKEKYIGRRVKKNTHFAKLLDALGYNQLADRIRRDRSVLLVEDFNAANTWTEYVNRLVGVVAGFLLIAAVVYSFSYRGAENTIPLLSVVNLVLIGVQGWLGSVVVSTNLTSWIVTVHMLLALAILAIAIYTYYLAKNFDRNRGGIAGGLFFLGILSLVVSIIQIVAGTNLREEIDAVSAHSEGLRNDWVSEVGNALSDHRNIAIAVVLINVALFILVRKNYNRHSLQQQLMSLTFLLIMLQIVTGIIMSYWMLPAFAQAAHITLASLVFGAQFYLLLNLTKQGTLQGRAA
ncbi:COX15/CtaA family protein [Mucilaginibacter ginkgonis]|uniref:COX15/CtaA family protein n=1 Tax=Mucilaginibacter ginkgonis TaxID=2682091 RepID=A0A6I4I407_9SPHI|nr:COX15/CtaA family protein [Mucilaginibacter ginkgonis]QQL48723.1 COX15/CtaA family protein [Mucilaginibacter ginkgonis]